MPFIHFTSQPRSLLGPRRNRGAWNSCLENWERPASATEEQIIERAARMVRNALSGNEWLQSQNVTVQPQGSYHNNTNVRQDVDMDLRVVHPLPFVEYANDVVPENAWSALNYVNAAVDVDELVRSLRAETERALSSFGLLNVDARGNKAIRIKELPDSRAPADVVPSFRFHFVMWNSLSSRYERIEGIVIVSRDGGITYNFPEQHYRNGVLKRARTNLRFKKIVRMVKNLRSELVELGALREKQMPSFLVECLVCCVENEYFLVDADDRYDRVRRVVERLLERIVEIAWIATATEINGIKILFHESQPWTAGDVAAFLLAAQARLEA